MVTQEVQLFHASLRDNLTLFDDRVDDARLVAALEGLGLRPWLESLPAGLDTLLEAGETCRQGRRSCWRWRASFWRMPGWLSSTRRRRGWTRQPSCCWSRRWTGCCGGARRLSLPTGWRRCSGRTRS
jgi:hypothetical protein